LLLHPGFYCKQEENKVKDDDLMKGTPMLIPDMIAKKGYNE
jgi:hypothetical protein